MTLGERILEYRKKAGISQEELADRLNITGQVINLWEADQTVPSLDSLIALAEIFNVSLDVLCGRNESNRDVNTPTEAPVSNPEADKSGQIEQLPADKPQKILACCETKYTEKLVRRINDLSTKTSVILYIVSIVALLGTIILSAITDDEIQYLMTTWIILLIIDVSSLIALLVRNAKTLNKYKKDGFDTICNYRFYYDCFEYELITKNGFAKQTVKYCDIEKAIYDSDYYFLYINKAIYAVDVASLGAISPTIKTLIAKSKPKTKKAKPNFQQNPKINSLLITMFVLSLVSVFIGLFAVRIAVITSPIPDYGIIMLEYMWVFFLIIPLPLTSAILGIVFLIKNYKCKKNIIAGFIMCVVLAIYGCFTFIFQDDVKHDFAYVRNIELTADLNLPNSGYIAYSPADAFGYSDGMIKFDDQSEIFNTVITSGQFVTDTKLFASDIVKSYNLSATKNYDYFMLYDITCHITNGTSKYEHNNHRFIYLAYNVDKNILYFSEFTYTIK